MLSQLSTYSNNTQSVIQEFSYRNFNSVVISPSTNNNMISLTKPYFFEGMTKISLSEFGIIANVLDKYIVLPTELKRTFYKTWEEITLKTREELLIDQIIHYVDFDAKSIPNENVQKLPEELQANITSLRFIKSISFDDFLEKIEDFMYTSTTIKEDDINLFSCFIKDISIDIDISKVQSKELKNVIYKTLNIVPEDAEEFLRYLIFITTGNSMLIKNQEMFDMISGSYINEVLKLFKKYKNLRKMAEIFNRYKPLFLSFKKLNNKELNKIINRISKLSKTCHKPKLVTDYLQITSKIMPLEDIENILLKLDTTYLVKLFNAVNYRLQAPKVLIYQVRNGKIFAKKNENTSEIYLTYLTKVRTLLILIISEKIQKNIDELEVEFINTDKVSLGVPTSGKQFIGNYPFFSSLKIDWLNENAYLGIYWKNTENDRVDLDFSLSNADTKIGWNSDYSNAETVYSGDITDAPNGAVEAFKIQNNNGFYSVKVNVFGGPVPFDYKLFIGSGDLVKNDNTKEMFENAEVLFSTKMTMKSNEENVGFVLDDELIFCNMRLSNAAVSDVDDHALVDSYKKLIRSKLKFSDLKNHCSLLNKDAKVLDFISPDKELLLKLVS